MINNSEAKKLRLELLLRDYEEAREEERQNSTAMVNLLGAALVSALTALVILSSESTGLGEGAKFWVAVLSPIVLLLPTGYVSQIGAKSAVRSYYLRVLERDIRSEMDEICGEHSSDLEYVDGVTFSAFSLSSFETAHTSPRTGLGVARLFPHFVSVGFVCANFTLMGFGYAALKAYFSDIFSTDKLNDKLLNLDIDAWKSTIPLIYVLMICLIMVLISVLTYQTGRKGPEFFQRTVNAVNKRNKAGFGARLRSYDEYRKTLDDRQWRRLNEKNVKQVFPKADDLTKIIAEIVGCLIALSYYFVSEGRWAGFVRLIIVILFLIFFEAYVYQTRYIVNDILGSKEERLLGSRDIRGRFYSKVNNLEQFRNDVFERVDKLFRRFAWILLAAPVCWFVGLFRVYLYSLLMLVVITAAYEFTRFYLGKCSVGSRRQKVAVVAMFMLVSLGWPLRFWVGIAAYWSVMQPDFPSKFDWNLVCFPSLQSVDGSLVQICCWMVAWGIAFGVITVPPIWALEALYEFDQRSHLAISSDWKASGKRHVFESLRMLFWPFGIRVLAQRMSDSKQMERGLSPREVFAEVALKNGVYTSSSPLSVVIVVLKLMLLPWSLASGVLTFASLQVVSLTYDVSVSIWVALVISGSSIVVAAIVQYLLVVTALPKSLIIGSVVAMGAVPLLFSAFHRSLTYAACAFWLSFAGLYLWGAVLSLGYFAMRYEHTRSVFIGMRHKIEDWKYSRRLKATDCLVRRFSADQDREQEDFH